MMAYGGIFFHMSEFTDQSSGMAENLPENWDLLDLYNAYKKDIKM
jgi:hypothetical protein